MAVSVSGLEVPEGAVVPHPVVIGTDAVGVEQLVLVTLTEVPVEAQRRDGEVGPAVADGEVAEVDVAGWSSRSRSMPVRRGFHFR